MYQIVGVTPEARTEREASGDREPEETLEVSPGDLDAVYRSFQPETSKVDLVVCGTPQLSLFEFGEIADRIEGRMVHPDTRLYLTTNYAVKSQADKAGYTLVVQDAGVRVLTGVCIYIMTAREVRERYNYRTLVTNSAKLANIISGYGYNPIFRRTEDCIEATATGTVS